MTDHRVEFAKAHPDWTLHQLGNHFGISRERVRQLCKKEGYKHPGYSARKVWAECVVAHCLAGEMRYQSQKGFHCAAHLRWNSDANPQFHFVKDMKPGDAVRLKDHHHKQGDKSPTCGLHQRILDLGMRVSCIHDRNDLLVMRWPDEIREVEA